MKKVSKQLMVIYVLLVAVALVLVALYEFGVLESGTLADSKQTEFVAMTCMELTTLVAAFLGLRLFKFPMIHKHRCRRVRHGEPHLGRDPAVRNQERRNRRALLSLRQRGYAALEWCQSR